MRYGHGVLGPLAGALGSLLLPPQLLSPSSGQLRPLTMSSGASTQPSLVWGSLRVCTGRGLLSPWTSLLRELGSLGIIPGRYHGSLLVCLLSLALTTWRLGRFLTLPSMGQCSLHQAACRSRRWRHMAFSVWTPPGNPVLSFISCVCSHLHSGLLKGSPD